MVIPRCRLARYSMPRSPVLGVGPHAPDRRKIGKDNCGSLFHFVSISKTGVYANHRNEHSAKPRRVMIAMQDGDVPDQGENPMESGGYQESRARNRLQRIGKK